MVSRPGGQLAHERTKRTNAFRASETRRRILEASSRLFSARGFANTTVRDIGREARVTDAAIYYHFSTKHDLLDELVDTELCVESAFGQFIPVIPVPFHELIEMILDSSLRLVEANGDLLRIVLREGLAGDQTAARRYREVMDSWERHVAEAIRHSAGMASPADTLPETLAREIVYTVAMGLEDTLLFGRDQSASPHARGVGLRQFLVRELTKFSPAAHAPVS